MVDKYMATQRVNNYKNKTTHAKTHKTLNIKITSIKKLFLNRVVSVCGSK